jgi:hypothetical protein
MRAINDDVVLIPAPSGGYRAWQVLDLGQSGDVGLMSPSVQFGGVQHQMMLVMPRSVLVASTTKSPEALRGCA